MYFIMNKIVLIGLFLTINSIAGETINSGPVTVSKTGELWVCTYNSATLQKCSEVRADKECIGKDKVITISPRVHIFGSEPIDLDPTESCARIY